MAHEHEYVTNIFPVDSRKKLPDFFQCEVPSLFIYYLQVKSIRKRLRKIQYLIAEINVFRENLKPWERENHSHFLKNHKSSLLRQKNLTSFQGREIDFEKSLRKIGKLLRQLVFLRIFYRIF